MATAKQIDNLLSGLRKKYLAKSDGEIVANYILDDINTFKKYEILTRCEMLSLYEDAVVCTDGEVTWEYIQESNTDLLALFDYV